MTFNSDRKKLYLLELLFALTTLSCSHNPKESKTISLVAIRHGQGEHNLKPEFFSSDPLSKNYKHSKLSPKGIEEAKKAGSLLKNRFSVQEIAKFHYSPLKRTEETAEIIIKESGFTKIKSEKNWLLKETNLGELEGMYYHDAENKIREKKIDPDIFFKDWDFSKLNLFAGETNFQVRARMCEFLYSLAKDSTPGTHILVTHGLPIKELHKLVSAKKNVPKPATASLLYLEVSEERIKNVCGFLYL